MLSLSPPLPGSFTPARQGRGGEKLSPRLENNNNNDNNTNSNNNNNI